MAYPNFSSKTEYPNLTDEMRKRLNVLSEAVYKQAGYLRDGITGATECYRLLAQLPKHFNDENACAWLKSHDEEYGYWALDHEAIKPLFNEVLLLGASPSPVSAVSSVSGIAAALTTPATSTVSTPIPPTTTASVTNSPSPKAPESKHISLFDAKKQPAAMTGEALRAFYNLIETVNPTINEKYKTELDAWRSALRGFKEDKHDAKKFNQWLQANKKDIDKFVGENAGAMPALQNVWKELLVLSNLEVVPAATAVKAAIKPLVAALENIPEVEDSKRAITAKEEWKNNRKELLDYLKSVENGDVPLANLHAFILEKANKMQALLADCKTGAEKKALEEQWQQFKQLVEQHYLQQFKALQANPMITIKATGEPKTAAKLIDLYRELPGYADYKETVNSDGNVSLAKNGSEIIFSADGSVSCHPDHFEFVVEGMKAKFSAVSIDDQGCDPKDIARLKELCEKAGLKVLPAKVNPSLTGITDPTATSAPVPASSSSTVVPTPTSSSLRI